MIPHVMESFATEARITLHVDNIKGKVCERGVRG
jgi:imidazoleglycerol phosphate dehydratase HisB